MTTTTGLRPVRSSDVLALQSVVDYPSVSVLCSTTPAGRLGPRDADRLRRLVDSAVRRLSAELEPAESEPVADRLQTLLIEALDGPADRAVALFVGWGTARLHHLPVDVTDRVVVDPTFATRDLVRALHRRPRHLVLVLAAGAARLLESDGITLRDVGRTTFTPDGAGARGVRSGRRPDVRTALREADRALGAVIGRRPAPVVVVGVSRLVAEFLGLTRHRSAIAGTVRGSHLRSPAMTLEPLVRPVIDSYLDRKEREAVALVETRTHAGRAVHGLDAAWLAAVRENPEMLAVEEGLALPARLSPDGLALLPASDPEHPEVIDDVVDELIETVLGRGGWVAMVKDGTLGDAGRVALTLQR